MENQKQWGHLVEQLRRHNNSQAFGKLTRGYLDMLLVVFGYTVSLEVRGVGRMGLNERSYSLQ